MRKIFSMIIFSFFLFIFMHEVFGDNNFSTSINYISLGGNKTSYGDGGNAPFLNFSNDFTILAWINGKNLSSPRRRDVVTKGKDGNYEWALAVDSRKKATFIIFNNNSNNYITATSRIVLEEGKWYLLSGAYNGTAGFIYVNGNLEGMGNKIQGVKAFSGKAKVIVGSRETIGGDTPFQGFIDEVTLFNKSLDLRQIGRYYNENFFGINAGQSIPVLSYHRIENPANNLVIVSPSDFLKQMEYLNKTGFKTISYDDYYSWRKGTKSLPEKPIILVFDDGWNSVYYNAFPVMQKYGFFGVLGIVTDRPGIFDAYMNWTKIKILNENNWQVGSHSTKHIDMTTFSVSQRIKEFNDSKQMIEENLNVSVSFWIYPFNINNDTTDSECALFYLMCSGHSSEKNTPENFLYKKANLTHETGIPYGLRRMKIGNETTLTQFKNIVDYYEGLVSHWKFDESGNIAYDSSPFKNNMILYNPGRINQTFIG